MLNADVRDTVAALSTQKAVFKVRISFLLILSLFNSMPLLSPYSYSPSLFQVHIFYFFLDSFSFHLLFDLSACIICFCFLNANVEMIIPYPNASSRKKKKEKKEDRFW